MASEAAEVSLEDVLQPNMLRPATVDDPLPPSLDDVSKTPETEADPSNSSSAMVSFPAEVEAAIAAVLPSDDPLGCNSIDIFRRLNLSLDS